MRTRKELVEAYLFVTRRIISSMMSTNPDALELPMRRSRYSVMGGILLAVLIFAGFWVVGMFIPHGKDTWKEEGTIVLDTDTGTTYVYMREVLFPVKNMASAKLISAQEDVTEVESMDIKGTKRGWELGISDAPAAIPDPESLVGMPWQVCSAPDAYDTTERVSHVVVSASPADAAIGKKALIASAGDDTYLLWNDMRLKVDDEADLIALGLEPDKAVPVNPVFASAVNAGPDLVAPEIEKEGKSAGEINGDKAEYGDYFTVGGKTYVLTTDGFASVGDVTMALLTDGESPETTEVKSSVIEDEGTFDLEPAGFPQNVPKMDNAAEDAVVCAVAKDEKNVELALHTDPPKQIVDPKVFNPINENDEADTADHFWLPGGKGALVREVGAPDAKDGTVYLLTDQGAKYALTGDATTKLGFRESEVTPVPASLVALVPTGPALDPETVRQQVPFEIK